MRAFEPRQVLDPAEPVSIGAMVGPEEFMELRYLAHDKQLRALDRIPELSRQFRERFGHGSGGLLRTHRAAGVETVVVALGSVNGTIQDVVDDMRQELQKAEEGIQIKWLSTIKATGGKQILIEKMRLDETGIPQPTGNSKPWKPIAWCWRSGKTWI